VVLFPRRQVLFNPGPVNLHPAIKESLFNIELCHRQPEFYELHDRVRARLFEVAGLSPKTHRLSLLHGSGSLAVDAALTTLVRGKVLVVVNGLYCERLLKTLALLTDVELLEYSSGLGKPPQLEKLEMQVEAERPDWIALVHHETTTGLLNPLASIGEIARAAGTRLFVDAVSSFGAHIVDPEADVICFNSNKCLESLPGIAGVFWRADLSPHATVPVLDLSAYADEIPSTPNVQAFVALDVALDLLRAEDRPARYQRLAHKIWDTGGRYFELFLPEPDRSNVLTSFRLGGRDPGELNARALEHGYVIYHGQRQLRNEIFRVANMGTLIDEATIENLFEVLR
jgi:2-aminoethylphosphonate-pyruvate transaminase